MTSRRRLLSALAAVLLLALGQAPARAAWDPNGTLVCDAANDQADVAVLADGRGGVFLVWGDGRPGPFMDDLYLQQLDTFGVPQLAANGVVVCAAANGSYFPQMTDDGAGGVIVAWEDRRHIGTGPRNEIYAQRMSGGGVPQWTADGVNLTANSGDQGRPAIASDGVGGAIVAWEDGRIQACRSKDIYAQRVDGSGAVLWPLTGVAVCTAFDDQDGLQVAPDGAGGAFVTWSDKRTEVRDAYAQQISGSGVAQWTANGVSLCGAPDRQQDLATVVAEGDLVSVWNDWRDGSWATYAQRLGASGAAQWTGNGVATAGPSSLSPPAAISDPSAVLVAISRSADIHVQKLSSSGVPQWGADGVALCTAPGTQRSAKIVSDGAGGAIVAWVDFRNGNGDVYAQRVDASGAAQWTSNGVALCTASGDQERLAIASDGAGGAIVAWDDPRNGARDIYAQRVSAAGAVAPVTSVTPVAAPALRLDPPRPNPASGGVSIGFALPAPARVAVEVMDASGRRVRRVAAGLHLSAGAHTLRWDGRDEGGRAVASGTYYVRIIAWDQSGTRSLEVTR